MSLPSDRPLDGDHGAPPGLASGEVPSPCIDDCTLVASTQTCRGCRRTIEEIVKWSRFGAAEKRAVWMRLRALGPSTGAR